MLAFDWAEQAVRTAWLDTFQQLRASGAVDGMYVDKSGSWPGYAIGVQYNATELCQHGCYNLTNASAAAWTAGKLELLRSMDEGVCADGVCSVDSGFFTAPALIKLGYHPASVQFFGEANTQMNNDTLTLLRSLQVILVTNQYTDH